MRPVPAAEQGGEVCHSPAAITLELVWGVLAPALPAILEAGIAISDGSEKDPDEVIWQFECCHLGACSGNGCGEA